MTVKRLVGMAAAIGCGMMVGGASAQTIELKVSHFLPPNHTFQKFADRMERASSSANSNGRLKLQIYPAGQLGGGPNRQFDSVRNGVVDMAFALHGATPGRYSTTELAQLALCGPEGRARAAPSRPGG